MEDNEGKETQDGTPTEPTLAEQLETVQNEAAGLKTQLAEKTK